MNRSRLEDSRRRFERELADVREALGAEAGGWVKRPTWLLPVIGIAAGLALAWGLRSAWARRRALAAASARAVPAPEEDE